jgi:beta-xylosidase
LIFAFDLVYSCVSPDCNMPVNETRDRSPADCKLLSEFYMMAGKIVLARMLIICMVILPAILSGFGTPSRDGSARNPVIHADVPDMSMIRVGDTWYMSSTTMHMSPGVPIMKSQDLVNWEITGYAYDVLDDVKELNLDGGLSAYGRGSWASCLRYNKGTYYVSTFSGTTNKTYIYTTRDIENGPWDVISFSPSYHDHTIFFDDDNRIYMIWGVGRIMMAELREDLSGIKEGSRRVLIENASKPAGDNIMLPAEGSQLFKVNGKYYLFTITWPRGGMRTVIIHRADRITGPWESRLALQHNGIAQGGLIDTPGGEWYAYLFRDYGAVGRIPYLVPVTWQDEWPVLGVDGKVPDTLSLPPDRGPIPGIVASDDFIRRAGEPDLPLVWQWNHNPDNSLWSVNGTEGYLRLVTGRIDNDFLSARNTLTQRTIGPVCAGSVKIDVSNMKDGDFAGLALLQQRHGLVGVKLENGEKSVVMVFGDKETVEEVERIPVNQETIYLKAECDFRDLTDTAFFFYSLDGSAWIPIGSPLKMVYTLPHFMGYRYGLFNFSTLDPGGWVDFDYFEISDRIH